MPLDPRRLEIPPIPLLHEGRLPGHLVSLPPEALGLRRTSGGLEVSIRLRGLEPIVYLEVPVTGGTGGALVLQHVEPGSTEDIRLREMGLEGGQPLPPSWSNRIDVP